MSTEPNAAGAGGVGDAIIGKEIDGCQIIKKIGQGGMGIVYLAEHTKLRQQYVVKILNPALTAAEDTIQRFFREAQSVARLNHSSIVGIQNVGQEGDYYYIRMEYVDGDTVENIVKEQKKLDWKLATKVVLDTAEALSHAHKKGIIHRDIKPENIMLTKQGEVKVMDFGLAKQVQAATKVSVTGQIVGTPFFMSPEQAGGKTTDARSDIYSLGVTYYYLLTGVKPFNGKNLQEIFLKHFFYTPESPKIYTPELPETVCEVIRRCLKKKKKERYQSAAALGKDLRIVLGLEPGEISSEGDVSAPDGEGSSAASTSGDLRARLQDSGDGEPALQQGGGNTAISNDLAAARAEIAGENEPGTVVSGRSRTSLTGGGDAPAPEDASSTIRAGTATEEAGAPPSDEAAPMQRRGNRVALEQVASASLVLSTAPRPRVEEAPVEPSAEPEAATAVAPEPPRIETSHPKKPARRSASSSRSKAVAVGVAVFIVVLLAGGYEGLGVARYGALEARYSGLKADLDGSKRDKAAYLAASAGFKALAEDLDDYAASFQLCWKASFATALANRARDEFKSAEDNLTYFKKNPDIKPIGPSADETAREKRLYDDALLEIRRLAGEKHYRESGEKAVELYMTVAKRLGPQFQRDVKCPVEVTSETGGAKVFETGNDEPLGAIPEAGGGVIVWVRVYTPIRLEVKRPNYKTVAFTRTVTGYTSLAASLERELRRRYSVGRSDKLTVFRNLVEFPAGVESLPVIDAQAGTLNLVCRDGTLRCVELRSGKSVWPKPQKIGEFGDSLAGCDVLAGKAILTASCDGLVRAHDAQSGTAVWSTNVGAPILAAPRFSSNGNFVAVGTADGQIVIIDALDAAGGKIRHRVRAEGSIATRPMIQSDRVFVGCLDDRMRVIDATSGKIVAIYDAREAICSGPVLAGNMLYIGTREGRVHALDVNNPTVSVFTTAPAGSPIVDILPTSQGVFYSTATELRAVAAEATGAQLWKPYAPGAVIAGVVPMVNRIALVTTAGAIIAVDAKTGDAAWSYEIQPVSAAAPPIAIASPPLYHGDELVVFTRDGEVVVLPAD